MAMKEINTQAMRGVANEAEQLCGDYVKQVNALFQVGAELDRMWDGDANSTFNAQLGQDQPRFESLSTVFTQYIQVLRENADKYDEAESRNVEILQSKTVRRS